MHLEQIDRALPSPPPAPGARTYKTGRCRRRYVAALLSSRPRSAGPPVRKRGAMPADPPQASSSDRYDPTVPPPSPGVYDLGDVTRLEVSFPSDGYRLAGHVYLPPTHRDGVRRPGVVLDGPMMSIKELSMPVYAIRLARAVHGAHLRPSVLGRQRRTGRSSAHEPSGQRARHPQRHHLPAVPRRHRRRAGGRGGGCVRAVGSCCRPVRLTGATGWSPGSRTARPANVTSIRSSSSPAFVRPLET